MGDQVIINGSALALPLKSESVHAIITDPPYGLEFMGQGWDSVVPGVAFWKEALRVLKPGGHMLAFGGTRTHHRLMVAIEDAGFEIRDCLMWLYGSGFPKSRNVGDGWGTALKPAWEPIILARKPYRGTVAQNVQKHGTGAINIEACRVDLAGDSSVGRWPANVILSHHPECELLGTKTVRGDGHYPAERGESGYEGGWGGQSDLDEKFLSNETVEDWKCHPDCPAGILADEARFFYTAKADKAERGQGNDHPTVKPIAMIEYLMKLVTREKQTVLDMFCGSGTVPLTADKMNRRYIGLDDKREYCQLSKRRIFEDAPLLSLL